MARGNTQESDAGDGNSWTDFVPLEESFTGTFFSQSFHQSLLIIQAYWKAEL